MSLGLDQIRRNLGVRLGLWSASIFALGFSALLTLVYYYLAANLDTNDREILRARLHEFAAVYDEGGAIIELRSVIHQEAGRAEHLLRAPHQPSGTPAPLSVPRTNGPRFTIFPPAWRATGKESAPSAFLKMPTGIFC